MAGMTWRNFVVLTCVITSGCAPTMRRNVGIGVAAAGGVSTIVAVGLLAPCLGNSTDTARSARCSDKSSTSSNSSRTGGALLAVSLTAVVVGGVLILSSFAANTPSDSPMSVAPNPVPPVENGNAPDNTAAQFPLDVSTACELAQQYLSRQQFSVNGAATSFRVLSCSGPVQVTGLHAELVEVHLKASSSSELVNGTICFEHGSDWIVTSAGTVPCAKPAN